MKFKTIAKDAKASIAGFFIDVILWDSIKILFRSTFFKEDPKYVTLPVKSQKAFSTFSSRNF